MLKVIISYEMAIDGKRVIWCLSKHHINIIKVKHDVPFSKAKILVNSDEWPNILNELSNITKFAVSPLKVKKFKSNKKNTSTVYDILKLAFEKNKKDIISDFLDNIYCTAWNDGARTANNGNRLPIYSIEDFDEFLKADPVESGYFTEKDLKRLRK